MAQRERQQAYTKRRKAKGLCLRCPDESMAHRVLCKKCTIKMRIAQRERQGGKPWKKGLRGRPPLY